LSADVNGAMGNGTAVGSGSGVAVGNGSGVAVGNGSGVAVGSGSGASGGICAVGRCGIRCCCTNGCTSGSQCGGGIAKCMCVYGAVSKGDGRGAEASGS